MDKRNKRLRPNKKYNLITNDTSDEEEAAPSQVYLIKGL